MRKKESHLVKFAGEGLVMVAEKQTLLEAALGAGIPIFHACEGASQVFYLPGASAKRSSIIITTK